MFLYGLKVNNDCLCMQHSLIGLRKTVSLLFGASLSFIQYVHCHASYVVFLGPRANAELVESS